MWFVRSSRNLSQTAGLLCYHTLFQLSYCLYIKRKNTSWVILRVLESSIDALHLWSCFFEEYCVTMKDEEIGERFRNNPVRLPGGYNLGKTPWACIWVTVFECMFYKYPRIIKNCIMWAHYGFRITLLWLWQLFDDCYDVFVVCYLQAQETTKVI